VLRSILALAALLVTVLPSSVYTPLLQAAPSVFGQQSLFGSGSGLSGRAVAGDLDGDGDLDLVVGNGGRAGTPSQDVVYLNDGEGAFQQGLLDCAATDRLRCFGTGDEDTARIALGDLNGDGALDIVVGVRRSCPLSAEDPNCDRPFGGQDAIYFNDGAGNFDRGALSCTQALPRTRCFGTGSDNTSALAIGDLNGDGAFDIVSADLGGQSALYLNDGVGGFASGPLSCANNSRVVCVGGTDEGAASVAVADISGDSQLDIVVASLYGNDVVYLNQTTTPGARPSFAALPFDQGSEQSTSVVAGDLDGNRTVDLAVGSPGQDYIYLNAGDGTLTRVALLAQADVRVSGDRTRAVELGDLDSDGDLDLMIGNTGRQSLVYENATGEGGAALFPTERIASFGLPTEQVSGLTAVDIDGDSDLDMAVTRAGAQSSIYHNDGALSFPTPHSFARQALGSAPTSPTAIALGDLDGDRDLDLVIVADGLDVTYRNDGSGGLSPAGNLGASDDATAAVALGDMDGDGDLDLVLGGRGQEQVWRNNGAGSFSPGASLGGGDDTRAVALGDLDGDGDLDLVVGNYNENSLIYLNDGAGAFPASHRFDARWDNVTSLALGDLDRDGDLDIVAGSGRRLFAPGGFFLGGQDVVYLNDGRASFGGSTFGHRSESDNNPRFCSEAPDQLRCFGSGTDDTQALALADINGDGDLDIAAGAWGQSALFVNDGAGNFAEGRPLGADSEATTALSAGDLDGDGDLDLVAGRGQAAPTLVYSNDGTGVFTARSVDMSGASTSVVALGALNSDGVLDLVAAYNGGPSAVFLSGTRAALRPLNQLPSIRLEQPGATASAPGLSSAAILSTATITVPFTLADAEGDRVRRVRAFYSLDGGGSWSQAVAAPSTPTENLATVGEPNCNADGCRYSFRWLPAASSFFGQSDRIVLRMVAEPAVNPRRNAVAGVYQRPFSAAATMPFRARGTQIRVFESGAPQAGVLIYRVPRGQSRSGTPIADGAGTPFRSDAQGYLQGRGTVEMGDQLVALMPVETSRTFTLYHTSAQPVERGLAGGVVEQDGVQHLIVSAANPLLVFNFELSLEWDARNDQQFMRRLEEQIQRTAEALYDWTNGQATLGTITVYHDRERWDEADIRVYATNRMRPNAVQGGIVSAERTDPLVPDLRYTPGQIRIGAVWNRYGQATDTLGDDWARALAHEVGHYGLFLDDNYLGEDAAGLIVPVDSCPGAMADAYRNEYSEFHPDADWLPGCARTLSHVHTGRSDWATITTFYPSLAAPSGAFNNVNLGPSVLPLAVTQVREAPRRDAPTTLQVPLFVLTGQQAATAASQRIFLFQRGAGGADERLIDLGAPASNQVVAHGARPGDKLCVFDGARERSNCITVSTSSSELPLPTGELWRPGLTLTAVNSRTLQLELALNGAPLNGLDVRARLFPSSGPARPAVALAVEGDRATGALAVDTQAPAFEGYVRVWVEEPEPRRELIVDYALRGNPGSKWSNGAPRGNPGSKWSNGAPIISSDGQVILFGEEITLPDDAFLLLQGVTTPPDVPPWLTLVGQAYQLTLPPGLGPLQRSSLSFSYLGRDVPGGDEDGLSVYEYRGGQWHELPTKGNTSFNIASTQVRGAGLYALMRSARVALERPGWNMVPYLGRSAQPLPIALGSIDGVYTTVYGYDSADSADPWAVYDRDVPAWVNDLQGLEPERSYWINATRAVTISFPAALNTLPEQEASATAGVPIPPTTFYGAVTMDSGVVPPAGTLVLALIGGRVCGEGRTLLQEGRAVYVVDVLADDGGAATGCGVPGRSVDFRVGAQTFAVGVPWNNNRPRLVTLGARASVFLPLLRRADENQR